MQHLITFGAARPAVKQARFMRAGRMKLKLPETGVLFGHSSLIAQVLLPLQMAPFSTCGEATGLVQPDAQML